MVRIQKVIAATGYLSRRKADEAIQQGRVTLNGVVVQEVGTRMDPARDELRVDGHLLKPPSARTVILLNKPMRVVTTKSDPQGRRTVMDLLPTGLQTLKPVGRLDYETEGMLILTDDGDLANLLAHPRYGVRKLYESWVEGSPSKQVQEQLLQNVELEDGPGRFEGVRQVGQEKGRTLFEVEVSEGRNRFVRRMWEAVGHPVLHLKRTRIGNLPLGGLAPGKYRDLEDEDLQALGAGDATSAS